MSNSKVLLLMTGSIAAYKACSLISSLNQKKFQVQVVATPSTFQFVGRSTLEGLSGRPVLSEIYEPGHNMDHIHLIREADIVVVAPATANFINKMALGLANDLASALALAHDFKKPFLMAPAMNTAMLNHPATQASLHKLRKWGIEILSSESGNLACGEIGDGRLLEPEKIEGRIRAALEFTTSSKKYLITAGGTQEKIDQVRVIGNLSTGRTGVQMASQFLSSGAGVTLLLAQNHQAIVPQHPRLKVKYFSDFQSLQSLLSDELSHNFYDGVIHAAAVSDYSVQLVSSEKDQTLNLTQKIASSHDKLVVHLKKNPKLIDDIKKISKNKNVQLVGFKLTSQASEKEIQQKVQKLFNDSHCDYVVQNDVANLRDQSVFHLFSKNLSATFENTQSLGSELLKNLEGESYDTMP